MSDDLAAAHLAGSSPALPVNDSGPASDGPPRVRSEDAEEEEYEPSPWHFKLLFIALVLYLGYRLVQLIVWLAGKAF